MWFFKFAIFFPQCGHPFLCFIFFTIMILLVCQSVANNSLVRQTAITLLIISLL